MQAALQAAKQLLLHEQGKRAAERQGRVRAEQRAAALKLQQIGEDIQGLELCLLQAHATTLFC